MSLEVTFKQTDRSFQRDVRARVKAYFEDNNITQNATPAMIAKMVFWLLAFAGVYTAILWGGHHWAVTIALFGTLGFTVAAIGFNIGHDAIHGSLSSTKWVNTFMGLTFDAMGASSRTWGVSHNFLHHTYTNVPGVDTDIDPGPVMLFYPRHDDRPNDMAEVKWFHKYQAYYAWLLYCFTTFAWVFEKDWRQVFQPDPRTGKKPGWGAFAGVVAGKMTHWTLFLVLPLLVTDVPLWLAGICYVVGNAVAGFTLAIVFQLAHVVEGPQFPEVEEGVIESAWCDHQMRTTANFAAGGFLATFICGGLNHQIEHHLFPKIAHIHYPALAPIVKETALEHGLPYYENKTFLGAVVSHARVLSKFGVPQQNVTDEVAPKPTVPAAA